MQVQYTVVVFVVVIAAIALSFVFAFQREKDNVSPDGEPTWDGTDVPGSLKRLLTDVETDAKGAIAWYWRRKRTVARASRAIQRTALIAGAAAGLWPVIVQLLKDGGIGGTGTHWWSSSLAPSFLVGVGAALIGLDKTFGYSSAWSRYVLAATEISRRLAEFRMDWVAATAAAGAGGLADDRLAALIQKAKAFRVGVEDVIVQETKDWATEFQNNVAQLEKDLKAQLDALKVQVIQQQTASQPGSLALTVSDADKTQGFTFAVTLTGADGPIVTAERVTNSKTWSRPNLKPGVYVVKVEAATATAPSLPRSNTAIVTLAPSEAKTQTMTVL